MFGFIGGLFVGLFGIFDKVLGGGKKSRDFLNFDDAEDTSAATTKPAEKSEPVEIQQPAAEKSEPVETQQPAAEKSEPVETQQPAAVEAEPAKSEQPEAKPKAVKAKKTPKAKSKKKSEPAKEEPTVVIAQPQIAPPPAANGKVSSEPEVVLFAPNYLLPKPTARRRRPGPNMGNFRQMAREMNNR